MSRIGIVYNDVANAAIKLMGLKENPTVDRVREVLGTGSKSTIARHLKVWKANNGQVASSNDLPTELVSIISSLWENLKSSSEQAIFQHQEQTVQQINEMQNKLNLAEALNLEQQAKIMQLDSELNQELSTSKTLNEILTTAHLEYAKNQERTINLEQQLDQQKQENTKLHNLLINVQNNLEHYQAAMQQQQQEQHLAAEKQKSQLEHELSNLRGQLSVTINDSNNLKVHIEQLTQIIKNKDLHASVLQEKYQESVEQNQKNLQALETKLADKIKQLIDAERKSAVAISRYNNLEQVLEKTQDKLEKLQIVGQGVI